MSVTMAIKAARRCRTNDLRVYTRAATHGEWPFFAIQFLPTSGMCHKILVKLPARISRKIHNKQLISHVAFHLSFALQQTSLDVNLTAFPFIPSRASKLHQISNSNYDIRLKLHSPAQKSAFWRVCR
jgi:hypothetical protein